MAIEIGGPSKSKVKPAMNITAEALTHHCRERLANYKVPRAVEIVDQLPINPAGKVQKELLRARAAGRKA